MSDVVVLNSKGGMTFRHGQSITLGSRLDDAVDVMLYNKDRAVLLLEGGADISPPLYGESIIHAHRHYAERDAREVYFYMMARRLSIPILGICRGHQLMAALAGGTLYQDMYQDLRVEHSGYAHKVHYQPDTPFAELMASNPRRGLTTDTHGVAWVNSMHHQSVKDVPPDGQVVAKAADGIIEAILYPYGLGVQWHPEALGHTEMIEWTYIHARSVGAEVARQQ